MNYAVGIHSSQRVWDAEGVWIKPMSVEGLVACIPDEEFQRLLVAQRHERPRALRTLLRERPAGDVAEEGTGASAEGALAHGADVRGSEG